MKSKETIDYVYWRLCLFYKGDVETPLANIINIYLDRKIAPLYCTSTPYTVYQTMYTYYAIYEFAIFIPDYFRILYSAFREYFPVRNFQICPSFLRELFDYAPWLLVRTGKVVDYLDTCLGPVVSHRSPDDPPLDDRWRTVCKAP